MCVIIVSSGLEDPNGHLSQATPPPGPAQDSPFELASSSSAYRQASCTLGCSSPSGIDKDIDPPEFTPGNECSSPICCVSSDTTVPLSSTASLMPYPMAAFGASRAPQAIHLPVEDSKGRNRNMLWSTNPDQSRDLSALKSYLDYSDTNVPRKRRKGAGGNSSPIGKGTGEQLLKLLGMQTSTVSKWYCVQY